MRKHHQVRKGQIVRVIAIGKPGKGDSDEDIVVRIKGRRAGAETRRTGAGKSGALVV